MDQGFGPKPRRVAAGLSVVALYGVVDIAFGRKWVAALLLLQLLILILSVAFRRNPTVKRFAGGALKLMDIGSLVEYLEERFEKRKI
jgi:hypothetical protein